ncbi:class I SAM-dependent methyltransferase [Pseudoneobacillus sp. C159]
MTNFEEYEDPIAYDEENNPFTDDIPFLLKWAAKVEGPIIDLACGTGRVTIPLAKAGHPLIGVDVHQGMLNHARQKSSQAGLPIEWVEQDCSNLQLSVKSSLIYMVGNSFQHFLSNEDQNGLLTSVNRQLTDGGIFIFGTRFPSLEELLQPSIEEYWKSYSKDRLKVDLYTISRYDALTQIQHYETIRKFFDEKGSMVDENRTNIRLRYVFPKEMERLLHETGFEILHVYRDWQENPLTEESQQMIYVLRKR